MIKILLILLVIFFNSNESHAEGVSGGAIYGDVKGFTLGNYNQFDQNKTSYGYRFGVGGVSWHVGNSQGLVANSTGGVFLTNTKNTSLFRPVFSMGFGGRVMLNTLDRLEDFYQWNPFVGFGPQIAYKSCNGYVAIKGGASVGNLGDKSTLPNFRSAYGGGAYLSCLDSISISYSKIFFDHDAKYIQDLDIGYGRLYIRHEKHRGFIEEENILLMYNL